MKTHEAEAILKYCADIPRRLTIIRRQCATLDDEVDTLKGINMDGMPGGGLPGDSTAAMACKMDELGIGDRLRSLERQQALLKSDEALIRGQIDRLDSVHNLILTEYYIGHKKMGRSAGRCRVQHPAFETASERRFAGLWPGHGAAARVPCLIITRV